MTPAPAWQSPPAPYEYTPTPAGYAPEPYLAIPYAGFWIRVVAYVIDSIIVGVIGFVLSLVFAIVAVIVNPNVVADSQSTTVNLADNLVSLVISFAYFAGLWTLNGATYGQRWLGLRVVDANTFEAIRPGQAALRWLGLVISFLVLLLGVIWVAFDPRKQGWMDKMASTVVVKISR
jgi:uncharacterized RDD family membrane protein YckC